MLFDELKKIGNLEFVLHRMLNSVQIALLLTDKDGIIVYANYCTEQLFGHDQLGLVGMQIEELLPERFRKKHIAYRNEYTKVPKSRSMGAGKNLFGLRVDNTEVPIEVGLTPLRMASGLHVLVAVVDITEREIIREKLEKLSEFSHMVSHDLNNPLQKIDRIIAKIVDYFDTVKEVPQDILEGIDVLKQSIKKSKDLINDLLAFARTSHLQIAKIDDCKSFVQNIIKDFLVDDNTNINILDLPVIEADPILTRHVFLNLISNAIKYNDSAEKLVEIGFSEGYYYVKDNGIGISQENIGKLFKPFTRVSDKNINGTGIGLSICKKAIERHNGKIWIESELGVGTTVFFNFGPT